MGYLSELDRRLKANNNLLRQICSKTESGGAVDSVIFTTTQTGNIPDGAYSYTIRNLGDGSGENQTAFSLGGESIPSTVDVVENRVSFPGQQFSSIPFDPQGNTLLIQYTISS